MSKPVCFDVEQKDYTLASKNIFSYLAQMMNKYSPRGKGYLPRILGKYLNKNFNNLYMLTKHNAKLCLDGDSLDVYVHIMNNRGVWDEHVFNACRKYLNDGMVFYDIGANIGLFSIELAKIFEESIKIYAFEPQINLAEKIYISSKLNGFECIDTFNIMVGDKVGVENLYVGSHSIHASSVPREGGSKSFSVEMNTIDEMIQENIISPPNLIKIDVEGAELYSFKGMSETINIYKPIIVFESDFNMKRHGYCRSDILDYLYSLTPYKFYYLSSNGYILVTDSNIESTFTDIIAIPDINIP